MPSVGILLQRALVVFALLCGIVAMHSMVAPMGATHDMTMTMTAAVSVPADAPPAPMPAHDFSHMCLAVLAALLVLGLGLLSHLVRPGRPGSIRRPALRVVATLPRPPPRTAVRLARLCVLRN